MAQRTQPSRSQGPSGSGGRAGGGRGRKPAPVKKPFPWGFVLGSGALAAVLIATIAFAVVNQGSGAKGTLAQVDQLRGLVKADIAKLQRNHVQGVVSYPDVATTPPDGGNHNPVPESCQVYSQQIPTENAVHSLEHGAVWVTYNPTLPVAQVTKLRSLVDGNPYRLMSPYPGLSSPISLQAWGRQLFVNSASDKRVKEFLDNFTNGPTTPERGAVCTGSTQTGAAPLATNPDGSPRK